MPRQSLVLGVLATLAGGCGGIAVWDTTEEPETEPSKEIPPSKENPPGPPKLDPTCRMLGFGLGAPPSCRHNKSLLVHTALGCQESGGRPEELDLEEPCENGGSREDRVACCYDAGVPAADDFKLRGLSGDLAPETLLATAAVTTRDNLLASANAKCLAKGSVVSNWFVLYREDGVIPLVAQYGCTSPQ